ncbi:unnamed protein product [Phytophthora lilii]|uniref:Unnamed protein product n=1 Tax=Phytophthora lilii TaxID=2077276 RepID=A0A9W6TBQ9_9STRA|nr:unnamed protein product [Phytophthora lilii]
MTITRSVQQEFLDDESKSLICIPCRPNSASAHSSPMANARGLAIGGQPALATPPPALLQIPLPTPPPSSSPMRTAESTKGERWTEDEHERFLLGMELFKAGPWKKIAGVVGTRDARQTMSHAQKYRQKIKRRKLGMPAQEDSRQADSSSCATSTTKRMRTATAVGATGDSRAADPVVESTRRLRESPTVQLPWEALGDGERATTDSTQGPAGATGLILADTLHAASGAVHVGSAGRTLDGVMAGEGTARDDRLSHQLDAALEPLDMNGDISVVHDSWLEPDELWAFLDGRPSPQPDVAGVCAEAVAEPRQRGAGPQ